MKGLKLPHSAGWCFQWRDGEKGGSTLGNLLRSRRENIRDSTYWSDIITSHYPAHFYPRAATGVLARCKKQKTGRGGGTHAVILCHIIVTAERLWQLWHLEIAGQDFNTRRSGEEGGMDPARGPCGGFTEGVIKEILLITVGVGGGGGVCIAGYVIVLYINQ